MQLIAHSGDDKKNIPKQPYENHIQGGFDKATLILNDFENFINKDDFISLKAIVLRAYKHHDLGKLCDYSQKILHKTAKGKMPNHVDAGVAFLLPTDKLAAWVIHAHHLGYNFSPNDRNLRDSSLLMARCGWIPNSNIYMKEYTDKILSSLINKQDNILPKLEIPNKICDWQSGLFMRFALSVLVSADHFDTASNYKDLVAINNATLRPQERLVSLDNFVKKLESKKEDNLKSAVYKACRLANETGIVCCKSEVGTGKTTATLAYALQQAAKYNKRKIVYVAPFTNLISQTVKVYRNSIVLDDERSSDVILENHHQTNFEEHDLDDDDLKMVKKITTEWNAPIICTTAVQFFETLAGHRVAKLKKLHQIIGSVIIIDESHNCIPPELWPVTLLWLNELVDRFGCIVLLASGSMVEPWNNEEIHRLINEIKLDLNIKEKYKKYVGNIKPVPSIIPQDLAEKTLKNEIGRVEIVFNSHHNNIHEFYNLLKMRTGSKLVVCNTIRNAATIASYLKLKKEDVLHMSTCLTPEDRELILDEVNNNLKQKKDWTLVATSCVETGLDISFQWGFRENSSLMSVQQVAGRINRRNEYEQSKLLVFNLDTSPDLLGDSTFTRHFDFIESRKIFEELYKNGEIGPQFCAKAFDEQLRIKIKKLKKYGEQEEEISIEEQLRSEVHLKLREVSQHYNVISGIKQTVIINEDELVGDFPISKLVRHSVQIYTDRIEKWPIVESRFPGFMQWVGKYDNFLGFYAELLTSD